MGMDWSGYQGSKWKHLIVRASQARLGPCCFLHLQVKFEVRHVKQHSPTPLPPKQPPTSNPKQKPLPGDPTQNHPSRASRTSIRNRGRYFKTYWFWRSHNDFQEYQTQVQIASGCIRCCRLSGDRYLEPILTQAKCLFTLQELILSW